MNLGPQQQQSQLGVTLKLPEEFRSLLEQRRSQIVENKQDRNKLKEEDEESVIRSVDDGEVDYDDEIIPFEIKSDVEEESINNANDEDSVSDDDEDDVLSLSPPESLPLLIVDLESLCGYKPMNVEEAGMLRQDIYDSLLSTNNLDEEKNEDDELLLVYEAKTEELFESGMAFHSNTSEQTGNETFSNGNIQLAIIPYPEYLPIHLPGKQSDHTETTDDNNNKDDHDSFTLQRTERIWKQVTYPYQIPKRYSKDIALTRENPNKNDINEFKSGDAASIVSRLLGHLANCSRPLTWKYQMNKEIRRMANEEFQYIIDKTHQQELKIWKTQTRPKQLDRLYQVRETFDEQLQLATEKYESIMQEKEERVRIELQKQKANGTIKHGGISALDWEEGVDPSFFHDNDQNLNKSNNDDDDDDENHIKVPGSDSSIDSGYEYSYSDDGGNDSSDSDNVHKNNDEIVMPSPTNSRRKANRKRRGKRNTQNKKKLEENEKKRVEEFKQIYDEALAEEERVREMCSTHEERIAHSILINLQKRMESVDQLLEKLQEEEWADEEEQETMESSMNSQSNDETDTSKRTISLLDQILAMALGALPPVNQQQTEEEYYIYISKEHEEIVDQWKECFGRLPPSSKPVSDDNNMNKPPPIKNDVAMQSNPSATIIDRAEHEHTYDHNEMMKLTAKKMNTLLHVNDYSDNNEVSKGIEEQPVIPSRPIIGLPDNDNDDWDDVVDWDDLLSNSKPAVSEPSNGIELSHLERLEERQKQLLLSNSKKDTKTPKKSSGLRPGGKIR